MKNRIVLKTSSAIMLAAALAVPAITAQAQSVISWNVDSWSTIYGASQYAGVVSAPWWNSTYHPENNGNYDPTAASVTYNNLYDNTGAATTLSVTSTSFTDWFNYVALNGGTQPADANGTYNNTLLNAYNNNNLSTVTLSSIPFAQYDLYVYFTSDTAGRAGTVSDGAASYDFSTLAQGAIHTGGNADLIQTTDTTGANPGADYAVFSGLTGGSQTINVAVPQWGGITGFQIVAVPEPGTLALAVMGGIGMLTLGRRFKARS
jgi:hypothetical protein